MVITTQEDVDRIKVRYDPVELEEMIKDKKITLPKVGQLLPKELRAKKLMSQKTTAVADVAFVLGLQAEGPDPEEAARLKEERRKEWWDSISKRAKTRAKRRARLREEKEAQLEARRMMAMKAAGSLGLNADAATRIAMEHQGAVVGDGDQVDLKKGQAEVKAEEEVDRVDAQGGGDVVEKAGTDLRGRASRLGGVTTTTHKRGEREQLPPSPGATETTESDRVTTEGASVKPLPATRAAAQKARDPKEVRVLWADLRDAAYAEQWPETVVHAELERMAVAKSKAIIPKSRKEVLVPKSRSIHVIGGQKGSGWYLGPDEIDQSRPGSKEEFKVEVGAEGAEGAKAAVADGSESSQEYAKGQDAAAALREKGIEVEAPRRGLWTRVKGLVGR
jgi:hypothetical protein